MTIGISRNARVVLGRLVATHRRGERNGLTGNQLCFTVTVTDQGLAITFDSQALVIVIRDHNVLLMLSANGCIEQFTMIDSRPTDLRYIVTPSGLRSIEHPMSGDPSYQAASPEEIVQ